MAVGVKIALGRVSAKELAAMIARGELSAVEAVEAAVERIEQVNPALNAVVIPRYDEARAEARAADERRARGEPLGPLHGVPITVKESLDVAGTPSTFGLPSRARVVAERDDTYVARLRAAGAIVVGKTNVPQLLIYNETDNPLYGRSNNPWKLDRTPGGSSGGEAAILAAGGAALGLGTDWGGSLRTPAAFCGIASLKPTAGRTPDAGRYSLPFGQRAIVCQVGPLARHVEDVALALEILNGGREPAVEPPRPLGDPAAVNVSALRVAYYVDDNLLPVAPAVRRAVIEAAGMLAGRGAQVVEWQPPDTALAVDLFFGLLGADGGTSYREIIGKNKMDPRVARLVLLGGQSRFSVVVLSGLLRAFGQRGAARILSAFGHRDTYSYWKLVEAQMAYQERFLKAVETDDGGPFDVILCPVASVPALPHGATKQLTIAGSFAPLYNVLGWPAGAVPVTRVRPGEESSRKRSPDGMVRAARRAERESTGLPVGVQVVARPWREHVALAAMRAIQDAARTQADYPAQPPL